MTSVLSREEEVTAPFSVQPGIGGQETLELKINYLDNVFNAIKEIHGIAMVQYRDGGVLVGNIRSPQGRNYTMQEWQSLKNVVAILEIGNPPHYKHLLRIPKKADRKKADKLTSTLDKKGYFV